MPAFLFNVFSSYLQENVGKIHNTNDMMIIITLLIIIIKRCVKINEDLMEELRVQLVKVKPLDNQPSLNCGPRQEEAE